MCGITGIISNNQDHINDTIKRMVATMSHRGPDANGVEIIHFENKHVALGHARLSILDLSENGAQPKSSHNQRYWIVHNGEIYNFKEIQKELIAHGHSFQSESDTEVILNAFAEWGVECVHKFTGMFAFAILDTQTQILRIFRDRAGVKPLYYFNQNGNIGFASELKALMAYPEFKKDLSFDSLSLYFKYGYIPEPHSIFKNTYKLEAGHYIEIDIQNNNTQNIQYWNILDYYNLPKKQISESVAIDEIHTLLQKACNYRMVSDVPVGIFLSGGYDSSAVAAILQKQSSQKIKTFTIGFEDHRYDEAPYAKEIATHIGTDHYEYYCSLQDALDIIPKLPHIYDEPFADSSAIPTTIVSQLARQHVTVSLSADGGDELFGGYTKYTNSISTILTLYKYRKLLKIPAKIIHLIIKNIAYSYKWEQAANCILAKNINDIAKERLDSNYISKHLQEKMLQHPFQQVKTRFDDISHVDMTNNTIFDAMMAIDYKTYMSDDVLHKVDRATMSISLEGREPLLDHHLSEYLAQIPSELKLKNGVKKHLLKEIVHKYIPKGMMDRPKQGFGIPFDKWFLDGKNQLFEHYLDESLIQKQGILNPTIIKQFKTQYQNHPNTLTQTRLWSIFILNQWVEQWL